MTSIGVMSRWSRSLGNDVTLVITSLSFEVTVSSPIDKQMVKAINYLLLFYPVVGTLDYLKGHSNL